MKQLTYPSLDDDGQPHPKAGFAVTRQTTCKARRGDGICGAEFTQHFASRSGDFAEAKAHPELVFRIPAHCNNCERAFLRSESHSSSPPDHAA